MLSPLLVRKDHRDRLGHKASLVTMVLAGREAREATVALQGVLVLRVLLVRKDHREPKVSRVCPVRRVAPGRRPPSRAVLHQWARE